jgi:hypothetical protein
VASSAFACRWSATGTSSCSWKHDHPPVRTHVQLGSSRRLDAAEVAVRGRYRPPALTCCAAPRRAAVREAPRGRENPRRPRRPLRRAPQAAAQRARPGLPRLPQRRGPMGIARLVRIDAQHAGLIPQRSPITKRVDFHCLRKSCARILIELNVHPKIIQQVLRHSDIRLTMDVYGELGEDDLFREMPAGSPCRGCSRRRRSRLRRQRRRREPAPLERASCGHESAFERRPAAPLRRAGALRVARARVEPAHRTPSRPGRSCAVLGGVVPRSARSCLRETTAIAHCIAHWPTRKSSDRVPTAVWRPNSGKEVGTPGRIRTCDRRFRRPMFFR